MGADYRQYPFPKDKHPVGWAETTVGEIALEIRSGYSSGKHNQTGQGIPHLRPMNVSPVGEIAMEDVRYVSPGVGGLRLVKDDILFTNTSSTVWVGKTALVEKPGDWGFSNHMTRLRIADGISPEFVAYQLHYLCISGYFAFHCKKHVNQSSVAGKQLSEDIPFRLPPTNEQKRIASKLRRLLVRERRLRQELDALPILMRQYRAAVLEAACTGRLVPTEAELARRDCRDFEPASVLLERIHEERQSEWQRQEIARTKAAGKTRVDDFWKKRYRPPSPLSVVPLATLPDGWHWARVDECGTVQLGRQRSPEHHTGNNLRPYLRVANVFEDRIDLSDVKQMNFTPEEFEVFRLMPQDILLNEGQSLELIGRPAIFRGELKGACFQNTLIRFRPPPSLVPEFAFTVFRYYLHAGRFRTIGKITTNLAHLGAGRFADLEFPLPPFSEQKRIADEVDRRLSVLAGVEKQIRAALEETSKLRVSLFHRAVAGNLVTQKKFDEPAAELLERVRIERESEHTKAKQKKPQKKSEMKMLSPAIVKEAIWKFSKERFSFEELSAILESDYDPLKDIIFELLEEAKPAMKQVFNPKAKQMEFQRIKP